MCGRGTKEARKHRRLHGRGERLEKPTWKPRPPRLQPGSWGDLAAAPVRGAVGGGRMRLLAPPRWLHCRRCRRRCSSRCSCSSHCPAALARRHVPTTTRTNASSHHPPKAQASLPGCLVHCHPPSTIHHPPRPVACTSVPVLLCLLHVPADSLVPLQSTARLTRPRPVPGLESRCRRRQAAGGASPEICSVRATVRALSTRLVFAG